uniref:DUF8040 domain-containing protein n=1 Tax=Lactuca sativa TaxID=4236 RepID=A0A9R1VPN6_LACSA|nr:hypothetical protein LSAT_V11C500286970 [Lactuca sativa]
MKILVYESDETCIPQLSMNKATIVKLFRMVDIDGKLKGSRYLQIDEQVAIFMYILAYNVKNSVAKFQFHRSGETISKNFNNVINIKPEPILETSTDKSWKWLKGCLGAIDRTHVSIHVPEADKPRYRNQKGEITTNVLAPCTPDMQFICSICNLSISFWSLASTWGVLYDYA